MTLTPHTKISEILAAHPDMADSLAGVAPEFSLLKNPIARATLAKVATVEKAAAMAKIPVEDLLSRIASLLRERGVEVELVAKPTREERVHILKELIMDLHRGAPFDEVKRRFSELVKDVDAPEIAEMEQQLIAEGLPVEEVQRLCDVHVQVFREALEERERPTVPPGHPVHTFMEEDSHAASLLEQVEKAMEEGPAWERIVPLLEELSRIDLHYLRKEHQLFPRLEEHGVTGPSQVMWAIHDQIRAGIKELVRLASSRDAERFASLFREVATAVREMIYKEERILFPLALETLSEEEWRKVREGEEEIGYAWVSPPPPLPETASPGEAARPAAVPAPEGMRPASELPALLGTSVLFPFSTGQLTVEQADLILRHLPVDISFVDEHDKVRYYTDTPHRIFPRSPGVIGRDVRNCHPPKSVHIVEKILTAFKEGKKDVAEFWIQMKGRFIHIRYFALRDGQGRYRGCLEVSQDVTEIRRLEGEKRLLDWED
ncbi:DUF438 domain-containing protein [Spirochaeta thermophila]|uniref:DUF438 domain-containing protein n=1 Tax=Winmispira thermophila (strain ATCC 49972 / DSM 6192 / RI 19.B1) TaxID=665571 RepID=E0RQZ2_WINT6|nr:DUF438 domain-containing protein [Spirochaeta thermophila]ADN01570.1 hypothetical protein STHERM_c06110 [Spirochaeta thermophila DSM 6192]